MMPGPMAPQEFGIDYFRGQDQVAKGFEEAGKAWWLRQPVHPLIQRAINRMLDGTLTPKEAAYHVHAGIQAGADADTVFGPEPGSQTQMQETQQPQTGQQESEDEENDSSGGQSSSPTQQPQNMQQALGGGGVGLPSGVKVFPGPAFPPDARGGSPMLSAATGTPPTRVGLPAGVPLTGLADRNNLGQMPVLGGMFNALGVGGKPPGEEGMGEMPLTNMDLMQIQQMGGLRALGVMSPEERLILQQLKNTGTVGGAAVRAGGTVEAAKARAGGAVQTTGMRTTSAEKIASQADETKRQQILLAHQDRMSAIAASIQRAKIIAARISAGRPSDADVRSLTQEYNTQVRTRQQAISSVNQMPTNAAKAQLAQDLQKYDADIMETKRALDAARARVAKGTPSTTASVTAKGPSAEDLAAQFGK